MERGSICACVGPTKCYLLLFITACRGQSSKVWLRMRLRILTAVLTWRTLWVDLRKCVWSTFFVYDQLWIFEICSIRIKSPNILRLNYFLSYFPLNMVWFSVFVNNRGKYLLHYSGLLIVLFWYFQQDLCVTKCCLIIPFRKYIYCYGCVIVADRDELRQWVSSSGSTGLRLPHGVTAVWDLIHENHENGNTTNKKRLQYIYIPH
jgi:hypothetical protein